MKESKEKLVVATIITIVCAMVQAVPQMDESDETSTVVPTEMTTRENTTGGVMDRCEEVMANHGLNFSSFWHGAAHGLHSISLEEIRHFFEEDASEQNRIPVVNSNLSSETTILFNAQLRGYDDDFKTMALKVMAFFMLNDRPDFYQQGVNTLEKITHQYHMHEIYMAATPIYKKMKEDPPTDQELCPCVNDVTANGILTEMVNIAKQLKYFARQPRNCNSYNSYNSYGRRVRCRPGNRYRTRSTPRPRRLRYRSRRDVVNITETIKQYEQDYLADSSKENALKLMDINPWKTKTLEGPKQWISYEAMLTWSMLDEEELNDFAVFMYCKLNQPELDHEKDLFE